MSGSVTPVAAADPPKPTGIPDFGSTASTSPDLVVDGWGDNQGYHVHIGRERTGFAWQEVAVLRPAGRDESTWTGYQCVSGDGRFAAVAVLPGSAVNQQSARDHGAFAYSVDLDSGAVRPLASGVGLKYFSPGCGVDDRAVFTLYTGADDRDTQLVEVDLATGRRSPAIVVHDQVTSTVPVASGLVGVRGDGLVRIAPDGNTTRLTAVSGDAYELRPTADGGIGFLHTRAGSTTAEALHLGKDARTITLGTGDRTRLHLFGGRAGRPVLTGTTSTKSAELAAAGIRSVTDAGLTGGAFAASLDGDAVTGPAGEHGDEALLATGSGKLLNRPRPPTTHAQTTATADFVATGPAGPTSLAPGRPDPQGDTAAAKSSGPAALTAQTPVCAVPRLNGNRQVMQPNPAQVNWAIQMAEQGLLTGAAYTRPAGFNNLGLAAYAPNSDFPLIPLSHPSGDTWNTVPRSVYEAIVAQESNWSQAS
ncbi:hypothetical protein [Actinokineospora inagensis]|uniref:hypothetical protein n=1 Tax=Actinokineospora inagensis TaxID=103730 RepID=UPI001FE1A03E|nr:hypothetical protein [Actinokineospora inagensis]